MREKDEVETIGPYALVQSASEIVSLYKQGRFLYRVYGYGLAPGLSRAMLLEGGLVLLYDEMRLDSDTGVAGIILLNENEHTLLNAALINPVYSTLTRVPEKKLVWCDVDGNRRWKLNYKTLAYQLEAQRDSVH